jgi:hypothetical protein
MQFENLNLKPQDSNAKFEADQPPVARSTTVVRRQKTKPVRGPLSFPDAGIRRLPYHWLEFGNSLAPWFDWESEFEAFSLYWTERYMADPYDEGAYKSDWFEQVWVKYWAANAVSSERNALHKEKKMREDLRSLKPDNVDDKVFDAWVAHRCARRATVTATVLKVIEREAKKAHMSVNDVLAFCVAKGWTGFDAAWISQNQVAQQRRMEWSAWLRGQP